MVATMLSSKLLVWAVYFTPLILSLTFTGELEARTKQDPSKPWRIDVTPTLRAQFDFKPYVLRDACLECTRPNTTTLFDCDVKCSTAPSPCRGRVSANWARSRVVRSKFGQGEQHHLVQMLILL